MFMYLVVVLGLITNIFPPIGRQYGKTITIPLIGKQEIISKILSKNNSAIYLKGIVNQNGTAKYLHKDKEDFVILSYNLRKTMRTLQIDFDIPEYDSKKDRVIFRLKVRPIFYSKKIVLDRFHDCNVLGVN